MPMNRRDYPANWKQISQEVRERAGQCCEECGVANHAVGARDRHGEWHDEDDIDSMNSGVGFELFGDYPDSVRIVLTVHHICGDTHCDDPMCLVALCQRCHLAKHRKPKAAPLPKRVVPDGQLELVLR